MSIKVYEYKTGVAVSGTSYTVKHATQLTGTLPAGSELTPGDEIAFGGKLYTVEGGADAGSPGGPEVGFFAQAKNGSVHFFSTSPQDVNTTYFLDTSQGYTLPSAPCFVRGTKLATLTGEVAVEDLRPGDMVATWQDGETTFQPVKWIGGRYIDLAAHARPETVAPIRIQQDAFADNQPHRDLLVSPDHAIFVEGKLICARQLANGTTIRRENGLAVVEYLHVELDKHAILVSEGLTTESYLDTGNRGFFADSGEPLVLHPDLTDESDRPVRELASCAPFVWDEDSVRPVWENLARRAAVLGQPTPKHDTIADPEIRILAGDRLLRPKNAKGGVYQFILPSGLTEVQILSRAASPTFARPWLEDHRYLGLYVERIVIRGTNDWQEVPLDHPGLTLGWWKQEGSGETLRRWTNGAAVLPLSVMELPKMLEIHATTCGLLYPTDDNEQQRAA
jgi:hypothetical protein